MLQRLKEVRRVLAIVAVTVVAVTCGDGSDPTPTTAVVPSTTTTTTTTTTLVGTAPTTTTTSTTTTTTTRPPTSSTTTTTTSTTTLSTSPPVARCGGPYGPVPAGRSVTFDGSGSTASNPPLTYEWGFGDLSGGTGPTPTHTYSRCNPSCAGPSCSAACLASHPVPAGTGCCPQSCSYSSCQQTFTVDLTVTDSRGRTGSCSTTCIMNSLY